MKPESVLVVRAGPRAAARIAAAGLRAADIDIVPGAAGGPKGLALAAVDREILARWLPQAPRLRHLVGASIGAWRFAAACTGDAARSMDEFTRRYVEQSYPVRPSRRFVSDWARAALAALFEGREAEILANPRYALDVLTVRGRWPLTREGRRVALGFGAAACANAFGRRHLARFIDRVVFHDARARLPFPPCFDAFATREVALTPHNLRPALLASASIPLVLEGVGGIPDAPEGLYWDGGIIDYHLHLPYASSPGLVLYPHFTDRIVPGWLDKALPWRRARGPWLDNVVLLAPSREFLATLPNGKVPDRGDFHRYVGDDAARMRDWRRAMAECERLAEAFYAFVERPGAFEVLSI
ncbi:MAG TPA: patatin-like phospholipase family protein [Usitatibacter sp.]|jgi:hypothetical protein|nr:patatin-like phospholipase family protein [Usitatibacter sp.]